VQTNCQIACLQLSSQDDVAHNISHVEAMAHQARQEGVSWVFLPECALLMEGSRRELLGKAHVEEGHPMIEAMQALAAKEKLWVQVGSVPVLPTADAEKILNQSVLIDATGQVVARYNKIHLFDVDIGDKDSMGGRYLESKRAEAGEEAVVVATPWGKLGMTICYDVRFPYLYRSLAKAGAEILTVPAAFTRVTGQAHWHHLLQARAIETGSYVIASAQCGDHPGKRQTYGHSLVIDP